MASGVSSIYEKGSEADGSIFIGILSMLVSGICAAIFTSNILGRKKGRDKTTN
jgi:thiol:disulfide interchange protein